MVLRTMPYTLFAYGLSDIGLVRKNNEDVWASLPKHHLYVLADGMGGHQAGEVAAREAMLFFVRHIQKSFDDEKNKVMAADAAAEIIRYTLLQTNHFVFELSKTHELLRGMGTTFVSLYFHEDAAIYAHVGDSRLYRYRNSVLEQLTEDHTLIRELIDCGQVSASYADDCTYKNIITRAIGTEPFVQPTVRIDRALPKDLYLLTSDGLTDLISNDEIRSILEEPYTVEEKVRTLIAMGKRKGGHDNITCICVEVSEVHEQ